jgi:type IV secretion system protein VirD4
MVGEAIEEVPTRSTSRSAFDLFPTVSRGVRVDRRPVMPMHEALEMGEGDLIVFGYGKPIRGARLHPYADPRWKGLYGPPVNAWLPKAGANRWFGEALPPTGDHPRPVRPSRRRTIV